MRKSLIAYALYGGSLLALYGVGGFSGWWKAMHLLPRSGFSGFGPSSGGSGHGGSSWGTGGGSSGGGFRGGK